MVKLLIVAPAAALTASLRFLLEAENYAVSTATSLAEARALAERFDCTVLDHHVLIGQDEQEAMRFVESHGPVVLLANDPSIVLSQQSFRTLTKPLLGAALSEAVRQAIGHQVH